jgi:hypothetical protein
MLHAMMAKPQAARDMLRAQGIDYILTCNGSVDQEDLVRLAPEGLAAQLGRGEAPDYLEPVASVSKPGWTVWRVRK